MKTLVILNCIDDAMHFRSNFLDEESNCFFVSTHPSVNDYLEYNNIRCAHLAEYIGYDTIREIIAGSEGDVNGILLDYDKRFSCLLSNALGIDSFNWFYPLYRYMGKYENLGIRKTYVALRALLRQGDFEKVFVYLSVNTGFYERESNLLEIARSLHPNCVSVDIRGTTKDYLLKAKSLTSNKTSAFLKNRYYKHVLGFVPKAHDLLESIICFFYLCST
jgi:hypothetical protein